MILDSEMRDVAAIVKAAFECGRPGACSAISLRKRRETLALDTLGNQRRTFPSLALRVFHLKSDSTR
jgi:hypothetical protein